MNRQRDDGRQPELRCLTTVGVTHVSGHRVGALEEYPAFVLEIRSIFPVMIHSMVKANCKDQRLASKLTSMQFF